MKRVSFIYSVALSLLLAAHACADDAERERKIAVEIAKVAAKAGSDKTVRIDIVGMDDVGRVFHAAFERLMHAANGKVHRDGSNWKNPNLIFFTLAPVADIEAYAKRLSFGEAKVKMDAAAKRVTVELPATAKLDSLWTEAKSPDGDWSILTLGEMKLVDTGPAGKMKQHTHAGDDATYFVAVSELPPAKLKWNEHLANAVAELKTQGFEIVSEKDTREKGIGQVGKEIVTKSSDGKMTTWRVFASIHNKRVYKIGVTGDHEAYDAEHFLTSFKIVKRTP